MSIPNYYPQAQYTAASYASSPLYSFNTSSAFPTGLGIPAAAQQPTRPPAGPVVRPSSPVQGAVNSKVASQVIQRLAASELKEAGFSGAQAEALYVLEMEVVNCGYHYFHLNSTFITMISRPITLPTCP